MFRNLAVTGILVLGAVMLTGCGESQTPTAAGEGATAAAPADAKSGVPAAEAKPGSLAAVNANLARQDTNADNKVSREEYLARAEVRFKRLDKNKDGNVVTAEVPEGANPKAFARWDKDGNKKVTLAEYKAFAETAFAKLDGNKDGFISADEAPRPKAAE